MRIAILGGTGSFGKALAVRLREAGYDVVIGSRDADRARAIATEIAVDGDENAAACHTADLVVLAVKADAALDTAREHAGAIGGRPLLSVASQLTFTKQGVLPDPDARSIADRVQDLVAGPVIAGLHSLAAANLGGETAPEEDALICGDDADAKALVLDVADRLVTGRAVDAGPLASARALEGLTAVIVNINKRYKAHAGIRVTGLE
jgi:NADPH-dependent F420 reductase